MTKLYRTVAGLQVMNTYIILKQATLLHSIKKHADSC